MTPAHPLRTASRFKRRWQRQITRRLATFLALVTLVWAGTAALRALQAGDTYDVVLQGGRVMDPESGLDAIRNVGTKGNRITAVTSDAIRGTTTIRADSPCSTQAPSTYENPHSIPTASRT